MTYIFRKLNCPSPSINLELKSNLPEEIKEWAFWLSSGLLGEEKLPLCPWAKKSILEESVDYYENQEPERLVPLPKGIKVRIVSFPEKSHQEIIEIRNRCNKTFNDWVFLDSHPDDEGNIGGIRSVYKSPLLLIQSRKELEEARKILQSGKYYSYWDPSTLKEILSL